MRAKSTPDEADARHVVENDIDKWANTFLDDLRLNPTKKQAKQQFERSSAPTTPAVLPLGGRDQQPSYLDRAAHSCQ